MVENRKHTIDSSQFCLFLRKYGVTFRLILKICHCQMRSRGLYIAIFSKFCSVLFLQIWKVRTLRAIWKVRTLRTSHLRLSVANYCRERICTNFYPKHTTSSSWRWTHDRPRTGSWANTGSSCFVLNFMTTHLVRGVNLERNAHERTSVCIDSFI